MGRSLCPSLAHDVKLAPDSTLAAKVNLTIPVPALGLNRFSPIVPNGRLCPVSGLKHASLYRLLVHGPARRHVRVCNLRQPGQVRAQTLFHVGDLLAYLSRLSETQRASETSTTPEEVAA